MARKIHHQVEDALHEVAPEQWATSQAISKSLLSCARIRGMAHNAVRKYGVNPSLMEEVIADVAMLMQTRIFPNGIGSERGQILKIEDVYFIAHKVIDYTCLNYIKKVTRTTRSPEEGYFSILIEGEYEDQMVERALGEDAFYENEDDLDNKIDTGNARDKLAAKIISLGWPAKIPRTRSTGQGRPTVAQREQKLASKAST